MELSRLCLRLWSVGTVVEVLDGKGSPHFHALMAGGVAQFMGYICQQSEGGSDQTCLKAGVRSPRAEVQEAGFN